MSRAHDPDEDDEAVELGRGTGESDVSGEDWAPADAVIWVPDLSSRTGYSKFWVNRREPPQKRRPIGFRRG